MGVALGVLGLVSTDDSTDEALIALGTVFAVMWGLGIGAVLGGIVAAILHRRRDRRSL